MSTSLFIRADVILIEWTSDPSYLCHSTSGNSWNEVATLSLLLLLQWFKSVPATKREEEVTQGILEFLPTKINKILLEKETSLFSAVTSLKSDTDKGINILPSPLILLSRYLLLSHLCIREWRKNKVSASYHWQVQESDVGWEPLHILILKLILSTCLSRYLLVIIMVYKTKLLSSLLSMMQFIPMTSFLSLVNFVKELQSVPIPLLPQDILTTSKSNHKNLFALNFTVVRLVVWHALQLTAVYWSAGTK